MDTKGEHSAFVYTTYIHASPERVWQGLTDPHVMKRYWRHQTAGPKAFLSDWKKGSSHDMTHDEVGLVVSGPDQVILESDPYHRLAFTWHTITPEWAAAVGMDEETAARWREEPRSKVAFDIEDVGHGTVKLTVTTTGSRLAAACSRPSPRGGQRSWRVSRPCWRRGRRCVPPEELVALPDCPNTHPARPVLWERVSGAFGVG